LEKEKEKVPAATSPDGEALIREKERESAYRNKLEKHWKTLVAVISCVYIAYHMYTSRMGMPEIVKHRAMHVGFILVLVWLYYPATKKSPRNKPSFLDLGLVALSVFMVGYTYMTRDAFALRGGIAVPMDYVVGGIAFILLLEACRRVVGPQLLILVVIFLLYAWGGKYVPGVLSHRGYTWTRIIYQNYLTTQGIWGQPIGVSSTYLIIFIVLGSVLEKSGLGQLFNDVAMAVSGRLTGGPAKVAVISSALVGTISGSAASNVATTGAFTIPLMKRVGYKPFFAGAIEAAASTGGQFMPPIMGSVAFIMAEFIGVPYLKIAAAAVIPALLYFAGVFFQIDLRARRMGLKGLDKSEIPNAFDTIKKYGHMIIPMFILVYLLSVGRTPLYAAFYTVVSTVALSWVRKETRIGLKQMVAVCVSSARSSLAIGVAMANAGFVVAVLSMTGIGIILADNIVALSGGNLMVALILCMVVSIILGMGLPTTACYVISSSIAVPILRQMGVPVFQAHFFVLYFACLSTITPPVALAAYVGAGMAGADTSQVGWTAFRLALAGFIVPFFFVYSPAMLLIGTTGEIAWAVITGLIGTGLLAITAEGFMYVDLPIWLRAIFMGAAVNLMAPGTFSDAIGGGLALVALGCVYMLRQKRQNALAA